MKLNVQSWSPKEDLLSVFFAARARASCPWPANRRDGHPLPKGVSRRTFTHCWKKIIIFSSFSIWLHLQNLVANGRTSVILTTQNIEEARQAHRVSQTFLCPFDDSYRNSPFPTDRTAKERPSSSGRQSARVDAAALYATPLRSGGPPLHQGRQRSWQQQRQKLNRRGWNEQERAGGSERLLQAVDGTSLSCRRRPDQYREKGSNENRKKHPCFPERKDVWFFS